MPSRADTLPFALVPYHAGKEAGVAEYALWTSRTAAGLFTGKKADPVRDRARRAQRLSPLVPADGVLRSAVRSASSEELSSGAVAVLAEQTLSVAALGSAAVWVIRGGSLIPKATITEGTLARPASATVALRPEDTVVLVADGVGWEEARVLAAAASGGASEDQPLSLCLRCVAMAADEFWSPLTLDAPHPSWAETIFNEYGTHKEKL